MTEDARFADGGEAPLRLRAWDAEDLKVVSALCQDAVFPAAEMRFDRRGRRCAFLINRFRWERAARPPERVQSVLLIEEAHRVQVQGPMQRDQILSLLQISWEAGEDGTGRVILTLAGEGAVAVSVEALEVVLKDVTRPYIAPSGQVPDHD
jgi:hypothetical protein